MEEKTDLSYKDVVIHPAARGRIWEVTVAVPTSREERGSFLGLILHSHVIRQHQLGAFILFGCYRVLAERLTGLSGWDFWLSGHWRYGLSEKQAKT